MSILVEYIINAKTMLEIQVVHHDFKVIIEDLWFYRKYFEELTLKIEKITNNHDIKPILKNFITSIYNKSMKKKDYFKNEISELKDWNDVESLVNHLVKSLSKNIQVDFTIEYHVKIVESSFSEENELNLSDEDALSCAKHAHKIILQKLVFDIRLQPRHF